MNMGTCQACKQPGELRDLLCPECHEIRDKNLIKNQQESMRMKEQIQEAWKACGKAIDDLKEVLEAFIKRAQDKRGV